MRKRRIRIKPRFWVILATIILISICIVAKCQKQESVEKTEEITTPVIEIAPKPEYLIENIPLSSELQEELYKASQEFDVDYYIMIALIERETQFRNVKGDGGNSYGYCQIQPRWWYGLMSEIGATDLNVPKDNFRTACAIVSQLQTRYYGLEGALVAYNQGYYKGSSTQYSRAIVANAERYRK